MKKLLKLSYTPLAILLTSFALQSAMAEPAKGDLANALRDNDRGNARHNHGSADPWTGFYIGGSAGYGWGEQEMKGAYLNNSVQITGAQMVTDTKPSLDSGMGSFEAGYDFMVNDKVLLGAEAKVVGGSFSADYQSSPILSGLGSNFTAHSKMNWLSTIKAKAGALVGDALVYVDGGLAVADEKLSIDSVFESSHYNSSKSDTRTGWVLGVGAEQPISDNLTAKIEYQHVDLGDQTFNINHVDPGLTALSVKGSDKFDMLSVGINYHF